MQRTVQVISIMITSVYTILQNSLHSEITSHLQLKYFTTEHKIKFEFVIHLQNFPTREIKKKKINSALTLMATFGIYLHMQIKCKTHIVHKVIK